jgi:hypothetical protein
VAPNVQWLQVLARLFGLLEHSLLRAERYLIELLLNASEFGLQCEHHVDVHAGQWWRHVLYLRSLIVVQHVHVIIRGHGSRGIDLLLHPSLLFHQDHRSDDIEVLNSLLLSRLFPHFLHPHPLDPPPLAGRDA